VKDIAKNNMLNKNIFNFIIVFVIFLIDRLSKIIIINLAAPIDELNISITSFLDLNLIWNDGVAFGLFSFDENLFYNSLTIIIFIIILIIVWLMLRSKNLEKLCFSMIIGGAVGNLFDRIYYSAVPDFIDIHINNFHWFIFNVADIFISLGVILLIMLEISSKKKL